MDNPFANHLQNVTDPSEFKDLKVPKLTELDVLQRCFICKEFMKAPMTTSCNHTFCSHCIREYILQHSSCPLCKNEQFESNLKKAMLLEEVINCYVALRADLVLVVANAEPVAEPELEIIEVPDDEPPFKKQRKAAIPERGDLVECPICCRKMTAQVLQSCHIDECLGHKKPVARKKDANPAISSFFRLPRMATSVPKTKDHLNFYFNETEKHNFSEAKRIPKLDFKSLSTPKLKEKLLQLRLPTAGTRSQLELRYNQYYILHNANLDSNHPVSEKLLQQKLAQWESSHSAFGASGGSDLFTSSRNVSFKPITDKDFLVQRWVKAYKKEFKALIKSARLSHQRKISLQTADIGTAGADLRPEKPAESGTSQENSGPKIAN